MHVVQPYHFLFQKTLNLPVKQQTSYSQQQVFIQIYLHPINHVLPCIVLFSTQMYIKIIKKIIIIFKKSVDT